jgi:hypothetical protein
MKIILVSLEAPLWPEAQAMIRARATRDDQPIRASLERYAQDVLIASAAGDRGELATMARVLLIDESDLAALRELEQRIGLDLKP